MHPVRKLQSYWSLIFLHTKLISYGRSLLARVPCENIGLLCSRYFNIFEGLIEIILFCWHWTGSGDARMLWFNEDMFQAFALVWQTDAFTKLGERTIRAACTPRTVPDRHFTALHPQALTECSPLDFRRVACDRTSCIGWKKYWRVICPPGLEPRSDDRQNGGHHVKICGALCAAIVSCFPYFARNRKRSLHHMIIHVWLTRIPHVVFHSFSFVMELNCKGRRGQWSP